MESYEVLRDAMGDSGAKAVAVRLGLSTSLIYKWCQEPTEEVLDGRSGARNPLDRVHEICCTTDSHGPVTWLCQKVGGFFVRNPVPVPAKEIDATVIDRIISITGCKPYLIQKICIAVVNRLHETKRRRVTLADVESVGRPEEA